MDMGHIQPGAWAVIYCASTGKFLMGKRSSKVNKGGMWNLFGGRVDHGERPREALVRELVEEAGLSFKNRDLAKLHSVSRRYRSGQYERAMHYYLIKAAREFSPNLNREHSDFGWFNPKHMPSKFNVPTTIAIKKRLLEKAASH